MTEQKRRSKSLRSSPDPWPGKIELEKLWGPWPPHVYFIRHGHGFHQLGRELVDEGVAVGPRQALGADIPNHKTPLSPLGRWQSRETKKLLTIEPTCVYVSDLDRAIETASILFPNIEPLQDPRLNEKYYGAAHMLSEEELRFFFPAQFHAYQRDGKYHSSKGPGGQTYPDLYLFIRDFIGSIRRNWSWHDTVVIVCHSAVMLAVRMAFEHLGPNNLFEIAREQDIGNCGIIHYGWPKDSKMGWSENKYRITLLDKPRVLWQITEEQKAELRDQALKELPDLQKQFPLIDLPMQ